MHVSTRIVEAVTVVSIVGDLDARTAPVAQERLTGAIPAQGPALLDMTDVRYISSAGLRTMLMFYRRAHEMGTRIALVGVSPALRGTLSATGFLRFFQVADSVQEGIIQLRDGYAPGS